MNSKSTENFSLDAKLHKCMEEPCQKILDSIEFANFISHQTLVHRLQHGRGYFAAAIGTYYEETDKFECSKDPQFFYFNRQIGTRGMMEDSMWSEIWRAVGDCVENGKSEQQPVVFLGWGERAYQVNLPYWIAIRAHVLDLSGRI